MVDGMFDIFQARDLSTIEAYIHLAKTVLSLLASQKPLYWFDEFIHSIHHEDFFRIDFTHRYFLHAG